MDWGTRRRPLGAIVAWSSLAIFAVLSILGIAGVVIGLQPKPAATQDVVAVVAPTPEPVEERLPEELSFAEAEVAEAEAVAEPVQAAAVEPTAPSDAMIASTFEQLVEPVLVPADQIPEGAVAVNQPVPAPTEVADAGPDLPIGPDAAPLTAKPRMPVGRNAAAWAIESEVPDESGNITALGYAAQPDDAVQVGDSTINVRSGPSQSNRRLFALKAGTEVDVTGRSGDWVAITDGKDREGWVDASLLENVDLTSVPLVKNPPAVEAEAPPKATSFKKVAGSGVTVRSGPGKSNKSLFNLSGGSQVTVLDDSKGWLKIKDAQGRTGWAYKSYIRG